ncbi:MAG: hypothetical protein WBB19_20145 [Desulforhopalus sp.]
MKRPPVTVIDAVMGTGKSTWAIQRIKKDIDRRTIVVLPYNDEVDRYANDLGSDLNVVALGEEYVDAKNSETKTFAFVDALKYADCIAITHSLFEGHINGEILELIREGEWHIVIDETISVFQEKKGLDKQDIQGFVEDGIATVEVIDTGVSKLVLNAMMYDNYMELDRTTTKIGIVKLLRTRDFFMVDTEGAKDFYSFSMSPTWIDSFVSVMILTYLFKNSDMDYWLRIHSYTVEHLELLREGEGGPIVQGHPGTYSGKSFRDLIAVERPGGRGKVYGDGFYDLSNTKMSRMSASSPAMVQIRQHLRGFKDRHGIANEDFMFTCRKDNREDFIDRLRKLYKSFIGKQNWLAFNTRGTNKWKERHYIYYAVNLFPFPSIEKTIQRYGHDYDKEQFALSAMLQFIWRSAIREGEKITILFQSKRMGDLFEDWLNA